MSMIIVMPPQTAAREPVSKSSLYSRPGTRKWTCGSMRPGSTWSPSASMSVSASGRSPSRRNSSFTLPSSMTRWPRRLELGETIVPLRISIWTAKDLLLLSCVGYRSRLRRPDQGVPVVVPELGVAALGLKELPCVTRRALDHVLERSGSFLGDVHRPHPVGEAPGQLPAGCLLDH